MGNNWEIARKFLGNKWEITGKWEIIEKQLGNNWKTLRTSHQTYNFFYLSSTNTAAFYVNMTVPNKYLKTNMRLDNN